MGNAIPTRLLPPNLRKVKVSLSDLLIAMAEAGPDNWEDIRERYNDITGQKCTLLQLHEALVAEEDRIGLTLRADNLYEAAGRIYRERAERGSVHRSVVKRSLVVPAAAAFLFGLLAFYLGDVGFMGDAVTGSALLAAFASGYLTTYLI